MQTIPQTARIRAEARGILTGPARPRPSLASLALLALRHGGALPALRMTTAADGTARYEEVGR